jgi:hypothetical protein
MSHPLLLDERIVVIQPALVRELGHITDAAVLQQLHYWMPRARSQHAGQHWVYKTYDEWSHEIGITPKQVRSAMNRLEESGLVISCQPEAYHRRKWYRIDYEHPLLADHSSDQQGDSMRPNGQMEGTIRANGTDQVGVSIQETTSSITSSTSNTPRDSVSTELVVINDEDRERIADAERLANLLADEIAKNGSRRPNVTKRWIATMDRMIRLDGRTPEQIRNAIVWCQSDDFWSTNILSPDKLRKHYERMRLQAGRDQRSQQPKGLSGVRDYLDSLTDVS